MGKSIMVASGKGGTGKTTFTANLGAALAMQGKLVVLVDMDMGLRNLDVALGMESSIVYDIADIADGSCNLDEALIKDSRYENLYFVAAPQTRDASCTDAKAIVSVIKKLSDRFDYCIIDAPAGMEGGFKYALDAAEKFIIVTVPEIAALRDADRVISVIESCVTDDIQLVINKVRPEMIESGIMMNIDDCIDMLQIPVLGIVCEDERLLIASLRGCLAVSDDSSKAGEAFKNIALRVLGKNVPIMNMESKKLSFLEKLKILFAK